MSFLFYLNNFHSQKVKPCGRTTRFSAGLHCQARKGHRKVLDGGGEGERGVGYLACVSHMVLHVLLMGQMNFYIILFSVLLSYTNFELIISQERRREREVIYH
jgi:hypothetical protein